ncbi:hypothetical protein [Amycolatopsis sp. NPDC051128]|uniref:hypothetical protein n=1 Tax=Amycolatopsis sp. NPDC051128 TaxID=3155412 RepID=UPI00341F417B
MVDGARWWLPAVAEPAGRSELAEADQQVGPADPAFAQRVLDPGVGAPGVPDGGDPASQQPAQHRHGFEDPRAARQRLGPRERDVHVAVDEPGDQQAARAVDALVAVQAEADLGDPVAVEPDIRAKTRTGLGVEDARSGEQRHASSLR